MPTIMDLRGRLRAWAARYLAAAPEEAERLEAEVIAIARSLTGRAAGMRGGRARADRMSPEARQESARRAALARSRA